MKILTIDDSAIMRKIIINGLAETELKAEFCEAANGEEALKQVINNPDLTIELCDLVMPIMNGIEFIETFRRNNVHVPVIMFTTEGSIQKMTEAIDKGANDYVIKPFTSDDLYEKIVNQAGL